MPYRNPSHATARWERYYATHRARILAQQAEYRKRSNAWFQDLCRFFEWRCVYCNKRRLPLTKDHVIPRHHGGPDEPSNIVPACKRCNSAKGTLSADEFRAKLEAA